MLRSQDQLIHPRLKRHLTVEAGVLLPTCYMNCWMSEPTAGLLMRALKYHCQAWNSMTIESLSWVLKVKVEPWEANRSLFEYVGMSFDWWKSVSIVEKLIRPFKVWLDCCKSNLIVERWMRLLHLYHDLANPVWSLEASLRFSNHQVYSWNRNWFLKIQVDFWKTAHSRRSSLTAGVEFHYWDSKSIVKRLI